MVIRVRLWMGILSILIAAMMISGCITTNNDDDDDLVKLGDLVTEDESTDLGTADKVEVYLAQGSGAMDLSSGASKLMEATFKYNIDKWKPEVSYALQGVLWNLSVVQPETDLRVATGARNEWDLTFSDEVPIDLVVVLGAGNADLDIGNLDLTDLDIKLGVGDLDLDLGTYDGDNLTVTVNCGAGDATLKVPEDMGVRIVPVLAVGSIQATGFTMVENEYHNSVYDPDQPHIVIHAIIGVGDLTVLES